MDIPEIVKRHVLEQCGRMPETQEEIDEYLDLINLSKDYVTALQVESTGLSKSFLKKLCFKTSEEIKNQNP